MKDDEELTGDICTYADARRALDSTFAALWMEFDAANKVPVQESWIGSRPYIPTGTGPTAPIACVSLRILAAAWAGAIVELVRNLLPQNPRNSKRALHHVRKGEDFPTPAHAFSSPLFRPKIDAEHIGKKTRSHNKGQYRKLAAKRGRPRKHFTKKERQKAAAASSRKYYWKDGRERLRRHRRPTAIVRAALAARKRRGDARRQARSELAQERLFKTAWKRRKDPRHNHHPEMQYLAPSPRRRCSPKMAAYLRRRGVTKHRTGRHPARPANVQRHRALAAVVIAAVKGWKRAKKVHAYWMRVERRAQKILNPSGRRGRPPGPHTHGHRAAKKLGFNTRKAV